jgi:hypothetical protein
MRRILVPEPLPCAILIRFQRTWCDVPRIFISYRREDSSGQAGRLYDRLAAVFGADQVFMDVDDILPGENFATTLRNNVEAADIAVVVIGPRWLTAADSEGRRRLDDETDFVRREVLDALLRGKRVVPVLLNGTEMPAERELPEPLRALALCQAFELQDRRFDRDAAALIEDLGGAPAHRSDRKAAGSRIGRRLLLPAAVLLAGVAVWLSWPRQAGTPAVPPAPAVSDADVTGDWEADVFYEWDKRVVREPFKFRFVAGQLVGSAGFLGYPRGIVTGQVKGRTLVFETNSQGSIGDKPIEYVHRYRGEIAGDEIRMVMQTTGPYQSGLPREFRLKRVDASKHKKP